MSDTLVAADTRTLDALLGACLGPDPDASVAPRLAALDEAEWDTLAARAVLHEVAPLLHGAVLRLDVAPAPAAAQALAAAYDERGAMNASILAETRALADAFTAAGIPVVALKGVHLAEHVYGDPALRAMDDVDVLVPRDRLADADEVFRALGYAPEEASPVFELNGHMPPYHREGATPVELHFTLAGEGITAGGDAVTPFAIDMERIWAATEPATIGGAAMRVLSPEDLLLYLCQHAGAHHGFNVCLKHVADIGWLLDRLGARIDWGRLAATARERRIGRITDATLWLAHAVLGTPAAPRLDDASERDLEVYPVILDHMLTYAPRMAPEWMATRRPLNLWLLEITGLRGRH